MTIDLETFERKIDSEMLKRQAIIQLPEDFEDRCVELVFSTETEVERWFGDEILGHNPEEIDLSRIASGTAPLLLDHEWDDQVGVVESVTIGADRKARAKVRFGQSARASEILQDVKDKIRCNVSVGYFVNRMQLVSAEKDGENAKYRVTSWTPYEISIVAIPADVNAGIGRSKKRQPLTQQLIINEPANLRGNNHMNTTANTEPTANNIDVGAIRNEAMNNERKRVSEISALAARHNQIVDIQSMANRHIEEGKPVEDFTRSLLEEISKHDNSVRKVTEVDAKIGLSEREAQEFSILRLIRSEAEQSPSLAPFEREVMKATREKFSSRTFSGNIQIPLDVMTAVHKPSMRKIQSHRTMMAATAGQGAEFIAVNHDSANFIEMLRSNMLTAQLGLRVMSGLVGNVFIPKQTSASTAYWIIEGQSAPNSDFGTGGINLTPHTIADRIQLSRSFMMQATPDAEAMAREDMSAQLGRGIDKAVFEGSGVAAEPTGIINTSGVGSVTLGSPPTFANMVELESDVEIANALLGNLHYVMTPSLKATLKTTLKAAAVAGYLWEDNQVNGYDAHATTQFSAPRIIFGNYNDVIVGEWGVLDIKVDPYTNSASGAVNITMMQSVDVAVRNPQSFSVAQ